MRMPAITAPAWRSGVLLAMASLQVGCDTENATITKPPEAANVDLSRPFGGDAPPARKTKSTAQPKESFVPKNPKLRN